MCRVLCLVLLSAALTVPPLSAQQTTQSDSAPAYRAALLTPDILRGTYDGEEAAHAGDAFVWLIGGFVGGATLGPVGTWAAYALASSREPSVPQRYSKQLVQNGGYYSVGFQLAFDEAVRSRRKAASLAGGLLGTGVFTVVAVSMLAK